MAASTWPWHVAALREAELTRWKRRLGRGKQKDGEGGGGEEWTYCKGGVQGSEQSPQLALSPSLSLFCHIPQLAHSEPIAGARPLASTPPSSDGQSQRTRQEKQTEGPHGVRTYNVSK